MANILGFLEAIKSKILELNKVFDLGVVAKTSDAREGLMISDGNEILFPADHLGNYFYLRHTGEIVWTNQNRTEEHKIVFVAYAEDSDPFLLIDSIYATSKVLCVDGLSIRFKSASANNQEVIKNEMPKKGQAVALKNLKDNVSLVRIEFILIVPQTLKYRSGECVPNQCNEFL